MGFDMTFHSIYDETVLDDPEWACFRLNVGGMRRTVAAMAELGMVFDAINKPTSAEWKAIASDDDEYRLISRLADEERPGIPVHKLFSTNDAWHVQAIECGGALAVLQREDPERVAKVVAAEGVSWWDEWIDYIVRAGREGEGFRVH